MALRWKTNTPGVAPPPTPPPPKKLGMRIPACMLLRMAWLIGRMEKLSFNGSSTAMEKREWQSGMDTLSRNQSPKRKKRNSEIIFSKPLSREVRGMSTDASADQKQQQEHEQPLQRNSPIFFLRSGLNDGSFYRRKNSVQGMNSSEATAERIMRDLIGEVSGQDNNRSEREVSFVQEQNLGMSTNNGVDFPEDDYFKDSRFFLPVAYFRGFEDMSLLSEDLDQDEERGEEMEEEDHRKQRHSKGMGRWTGRGQFGTSLPSSPHSAVNFHARPIPFCRRSG
ncbi:hypothetical protein MOQ_009812 [Trypanosoma cruzi marinkellei]|uniref:Uncharacterized protein n=1 Tax=Trypanosoma cruzi marinkellei TaxID=85056 RepID=K2LUP2_TRYCR|nr:hypothetical protein MOQ_009812 [Trypanosoma cruzi marinkellei]